MSTIYTIAAQSILASAGGTDLMLIHSSTEGRTARLPMTSVRAYVLASTTVVGTTAAVSTGVATNGASTVWGFSTSTQANAIINILYALRASI